MVIIFSLARKNNAYTHIGWIWLNVCALKAKKISIMNTHYGYNNNKNKNMANKNHMEMLFRSKPLAPMLNIVFWFFTIFEQWLSSNKELEYNQK